MRHVNYDQAHLNLAGEYNRARSEGATSMTLDKYCSIVRSFANVAMTLDRTPSPDSMQRFNRFEIEEMILVLEPID
jgi:hypothetical protein